MLRSVVFIDLDHTLLEGPFETAVFPIVLGEIAAQTGLSVETLKELARQENRARIAAARQQPPAVVAAMDWDAIFAALAARLGVRLQARAADVVRQYARPPYIALHPGARQALQTLAAGPQRLLLAATKGLRKYQLPVLAALDLLPFFEELITPDSYGAMKQDLAFYGPWPQRAPLCIMVGDTYEDDVLPASGFGFKTVWRLDAASQPGEDLLDGAGPFERPARLPAYPGGGHTRPDAIILGLAELPGVVEQLEHPA